MAKVMVAIDRRQVESAIRQLSTEEKLKLFKDLGRETRKERWDELIYKIRNRYKKNPISDEEITQICESVRQERYEKSIKSGD